MSQGWRPNLNWAGLGRSGWHLQFSRPGPAWRSSEGPGPQYRQSATRLWNSLILQRGLWIMQSIVCSRSMGLQLLNKYHDVMSHNIISILNIWCRKRRSLWNVQPKLKSQKKNCIFFAWNHPSMPRGISWHHWKNLLTSKRGCSGGSNFSTEFDQIWLKSSGGSRELIFGPICKCHTILESSWHTDFRFLKLKDLGGH